MSKFTYRVFDEYSNLIGATCYPEDAAALVAVRSPGGGTVKAGHTVVWTEGSECIEAGDSYDQAGNIMWYRREIARCGKNDVEYRAKCQAELDEYIATAG